jgi:hypothetical protein
MSTRVSRIHPDIAVPPRAPHETVFQLRPLPAGIDFAAMEVTRFNNDNWEPRGSVHWIWIEYIGEWSALLKMPGLLHEFFNAGKSGHRRHRDAQGYSVFVRRYANDRWKLRIDARGFQSDADIAAHVAWYWPEPVQVPLIALKQRVHLRLVVDNTQRVSDDGADEGAA